MTVHAIEQPDWRADGARRRILWNDETGEVSGDHGELPFLRSWLADAAKDGFILLRGEAAEPRRPASAGAVPRGAPLTMMARWDPDGLPPALRTVEPTPWRQALAGAIT